MWSTSLSNEKLQWGNVDPISLTFFFQIYRVKVMKGHRFAFVTEGVLHPKLLLAYTSQNSSIFFKYFLTDLLTCIPPSLNQQKSNSM